MFDEQDIQEILRLVCCALSEGTDAKDTKKLLIKMKEIYKDNESIKKDIEYYIKVIETGRW